MTKHDYIDVFKVLSINAASITLAGAQQFLGIIALCVSIGYTCWKWYMGWKRHKPLDTVTGDQ